MRLVVDHLRGSRCGERQVFADPERVSFGRHPQTDVTFDAHRDIDASSRHAEVRAHGDGFVLRDVGSSNGTRVGGELVTERTLEPGRAVEVEFGPRGPVVRLWLGEGEPGVPVPAEERPRRRRRLVAAVAVAVLAAAAALAL